MLDTDDDELLPILLAAAEDAGNLEALRGEAGP